MSLDFSYPVKSYFQKKNLMYFFDPFADIVDGHRSHLRWKGNYSELDARHWTPEMRSALNYDPKSAQNFDNGVFWVSASSVQKISQADY